MRQLPERSLLSLVCSLGTSIGILASASFLAQADTNEDGAVNFLDIQGFIDILAGN